MLKNPMLTSLLKSIDGVDDEREFLFNLFKSGQIGSLIGSLVNDQTQLEKIIQLGAYTHPNGFYKISLGKSLGRKKIRLHVWPKSMDMKLYQQGIHDHPWEFSSVVIVGSVISRIYSVDSKGFSYYKHICRVDDVENFGHDIDYAREESLGMLMEIHLAQGSCYFERQDVLHQVLPGSTDTLTATLVVQSEPRGKETRLYLDKIHNEKVVNTALTPNELSRVFGELFVCMQ